MIVRPIEFADVPAWKRLRVALWPQLSSSENDRESAHIREQPAQFVVFVAAAASGAVEGFIEASLRQYADGCDTSPVGYIEGWFVTRQHRRAGIGRQLVQMAEDWARAKGCTEMGSDSILENLDGQRAHARLGYIEVERQVCFRKSLT